MLAALNVAMHQPMFQRLIPSLVLGVLAASAAPAEDPAHACLPDGGGRLLLQISGDFDARIDWGNEGTRCDGGPRPEGDALRLMFSRDDDSLLFVIGITGLVRGWTGAGLAANLTVVRQGAGEFYGTLGADACVVEVDENLALATASDSYRVSGRGSCERPIEAVARAGEIRISTFEFTGIAYWPDEDN
jgi:hypothetical protein